MTSKNAERRRLAEQQSAQLAANAANRGIIDTGSNHPVEPARLPESVPVAPPAEGSAPVATVASDSAHTGAPVRTPAPKRAPPAEFMLIINGQLDRSVQCAKPVQFIPTARNWERFKAAFNGSSGQVGMNAVFKAGLDALAAQGGLIKIEAEDLA